MSTITAKDLTKEYPRSPFEEMGGFPWLARLIDKVRALQAGKIGAYTPFPCGGDQNFLKTIGIEPAAIKEVIDGGASDQEILAWVQQHASGEAAKNLEGYRAFARTPHTGEMAGYLQGSIDELKQERPELDYTQAITFGHLICLEEGHPLP